MKASKWEKSWSFVLLTGIIITGIACAGCLDGTDGNEENSAPVLLDYSVKVEDTYVDGNITMILDGHLMIQIYANDPDGDALTVKWYVDNIFENEHDFAASDGNSTSKLFLGEGDMSVGDHIIKVMVSDDKDTITKEWTITVEEAPVTMWLSTSIYSSTSANVEMRPSTPISATEISIAIVNGTATTTLEYDLATNTFIPTVPGNDPANIIPSSALGLTFDDADIDGDIDCTGDGFIFATLSGYTYELSILVDGEVVCSSILYC